MESSARRWSEFTLIKDDINKQNKYKKYLIKSDLSFWTRIGRDGVLKMQKMISKEDDPDAQELTEPPVVQTGSSSEGANVLDIDSSSLMFIGGVPLQFAVSEDTIGNYSK